MKKSQNGPLAEKRQNRKSKRTRQKKKKARKEIGKGESSDSPEIPDRRINIKTFHGLN